jgi:hypothetical protein
VIPDEFDLAFLGEVDPEFTASISGYFLRLLEAELREASRGPATARPRRTEPPIAAGRVKNAKVTARLEFEAFKLPKEPVDPPFPDMHLPQEFAPTSDEGMVATRPREFAVPLIALLEEPPLEKEFARYPIASRTRRVTRTT